MADLEGRFAPPPPPPQLCMELIKIIAIADWLLQYKLFLQSNMLVYANSTPPPPPPPSPFTKSLDPPLGLLAKPGDLMATMGWGWAGRNSRSEHGRSSLEGGGGGGGGEHPLASHLNATLHNSYQDPIVLQLCQVCVQVEILDIPPLFSSCHFCTSGQKLHSSCRSYYSGARSNRPVQLHADTVACSHCNFMGAPCTCYCLKATGHGTYPC